MLKHPHYKGPKDCMNDYKLDLKRKETKSKGKRDCMETMEIATRIKYITQWRENRCYKATTIMKL